MRPLVCRHPWMIIASIITALFLVLSIYDGYRTPTALAQYARRGDFYGPQTTVYGEQHSALPLFDLAMKIMVPYGSEQPDDQSIRLSSGTFRTSFAETYPPPVIMELRRPLDEAYPLEVQARVHAFVANNRQAIALIEEGATMPQLATPEQLRHLRGQNTRIGNIPVDLHPKAQFVKEQFYIASIMRLAHAHALVALFNQDAEAFVRAIEQSCNILTLFIRGGLLPEEMFLCFWNAFNTLDLVQHGINRLHLETADLGRLRRSIAKACTGNTRYIRLAYNNSLWKVVSGYDSTGKAAYMPPRPPRHISSVFNGLVRTWLPLPHLAQQSRYYHHYLLNVVRAGDYYHNMGERDFLLKQDMSTGADELRVFAYDRSRASNISTKFNAFSLPFTGILAKPQAYQPYWIDYEPYVTLLSYARAADTVLAAAQFRIDHGRLPEGLLEMIPEYIPTMPLDPRGYERTLTYQHQEDCTVIQGRVINESVLRRTLKSEQLMALWSYSGLRSQTTFILLHLPQAHDENSMHAPDMLPNEIQISMRR